MPALNNYSFQFGSFVFGGAGSPYQIMSVDGLEGLPALRVQDDNRGFNDGMFSGQDFLAGRTISMIILITGSGGNSAAYNFNLLQAALLPQTTGTTQMFFQLSPASGTQFVNSRVRVLRSTVDPEYTYGFIRCQLELFCPDPRYYDQTLQSASLNVSNPLGRTYNRTYNLVYGGGSYATTTTVTNSGWTATYPTITLNGPITNPTFGNVTQGLYLTLTGTYTNTDNLVIDLYNKLITLNGVSARYLISSGNWFSASSGTNQFYLTGTYTVPGTTAATVTWYNAYV